MKRPTFLRLPASWRRDKNSGPGFRGGETGPVEPRRRDGHRSPADLRSRRRGDTPSWHELVQAPDPNGPAAVSQKRATERTLRKRHGVFRAIKSAHPSNPAHVDHPANAMPRREMRVTARARGLIDGGRLVQHPTRRKNANTVQIQRHRPGWARRKTTAPAPASMFDVVARAVTAAKEKAS